MNVITNTSYKYKIQLWQYIFIALFFQGTLHCICIVSLFPLTALFGALVVVGGAEQPVGVKKPQEKKSETTFMLPS